MTNKYCTSEPVSVNDGIINHVYQTSSCIKIANNVKGTMEGSKDAYAFKNVVSSVTEIDFSEATNLEQIGAFSFYNCSKISSFNLTACKKLKSIGVCAFMLCTNATSITLPEQSPLSILPGGCFCNCSSLKSFQIPSSIEQLDNAYPDSLGVFGYCESLKIITFSANSKCTTVGDKAFLESAIVSLQLPPSISEINGFSIRKAIYLEKIEMSEDDSAKFYTKDGLLMRKSDDSLVYYPNLNQYVQNGKAVLPGFVNSIESYAFSGLNCDVIEIPTSLTEIGQSSLSYTSVKQIIIPSTITSFKNYAFQCNYILENVTFYNTFSEIPIYAFLNCYQLKSFIIPPNVETINSYAFSGCSKLQYIFIPNTVTTFGLGPFINCDPLLVLDFQEGSDLLFENGFLYDKQINDLTIILYIGNQTEIQINENVTKINSGAFQNKEIVTVAFENENKISQIGDSAFSQCKSLKNIQLPSKLNTISQSLFSECSALQSINIPSAIENIGIKAFYLCTSLQNITFEPDSKLVRIYNESFSGCTQLQNIQIPNSVNRIYTEAFKQCTKLTSINLPDSLEKMGEYIFKYSGIRNIQYSQSSIGIENLTTYCFGNMDYLETFTIPNSVKVVKANAFYSCPQLNSVTFGNNLEIIDDYAFNNNENLQYINMSENDCLTNLTAFTFNNCPKLISFHLTAVNNFQFHDGMLFNQNETILILFLKATPIENITIPQTVMSISQCAFSDCSKIKRVTFEGNSSITEIKYLAFYNCTSLESVNFPASLQILGSGVFQFCNLRYIFLTLSHIEELPESVFSGNKRLSEIFLPVTLKNVSQTSFSNIHSNAYVFYHGSNIIINEAGLSSRSHVYCYEDYKQDIFLGLPVRRHFVCYESHEYNMNSISLKSLAYIMIVYSIQ